MTDNDRTKNPNPFSKDFGRRSKDAIPLVLTALDTYIRGELERHLIHAVKRESHEHNPEKFAIILNCAMAMTRVRFASAFDQTDFDIWEFEKIEKVKEFADHILYQIKGVFKTLNKII